MATLARLLGLLICLCLLSGCGSWRLSQLWEGKDPAAHGAPTDMQGLASSTCAPDVTDSSTALDTVPPTSPLPMGAPDIPASLAGAVSPAQSGKESEARSGGQAPAEPVLPYTVHFTAPNQPEALEILQKNSLLVRLLKTPPPDLMGLEFRIVKDEAEARTIMQSLGYYSGTVISTIDTDKNPVQVHVRLESGPRYTVGSSTITYDGAVLQKAPKNLQEAGLPADSPATASTVLDSVDSISQWLKSHGYPLAQVDSTHYSIDPEKHLLNAEIHVQQGPLARMGTVKVEGSDSITPEYLNRLRTWRSGRLWNDKRLDAYRNELTQLGLFRSISLQPVPLQSQPPLAEDATQSSGNARTIVDTAPLYDVLLSVADAPQRTVGGGLNYESDRGIGGQAFWEHRNVFSEGERLRTELGLWEDRQNARVSFTKPAFLQRGQNFNAEAWLRSEDTDAYFQEAAWAGVGIERRLSRHWWASVKASAEGGILRDPKHPRKSYSMLGLPLGLRYDNTSSLLNSTEGVRAALNITPYNGMYGKEFSTFRTRLDASAYLPLTASKSVVLAARASAGSILRDDAMTVPASIRFYSGGGGSVRGYAYQSLGPRDSDKAPLGGASFLELGLETRIKITENIGIVPFLDGGNAYSEQIPRLDKSPLQWGAGLGLRYYTAIGPLRLDVATPLNPRKDDAPFFVYISIGQSF